VAQVDDVQLFRERLNQQVVQRINFPCDAVNILLPLAWPQEDEQGVIAQDGATVLPAIDEYRVVTPLGMDVLCLSVPFNSLQGLLDEAVLEVLTASTVSRRVCLPPARLANDIRALQSLMVQGIGWQTLQLKRSLTMLVVEWLETVVDTGQVLPRPSTRSYIVERCHQWLMEAPDAAPSVLELCKRLKVSRRTLQYSFQSVAAVTPVQYLRSVRLNGARRSLKQNPKANIAEVAERWGFGHSSYFTLEYQKLFNELPSALLRRRASEGFEQQFCRAPGMLD
jgi:AraC family ethanolamine operon transcriptional activator